MLGFELVEEPVIQRSVILELERTERMRDAFERIGQAMREVIHRVDLPLVAGVLALIPLVMVLTWMRRKQVLVGA